MTPPFRGFVVRALLPAAVWAMMCGLAYVEVQHALRTGADDPQIQLAEDAATSLAGGASPDAVVGGPSIDAAASLAPWLTVYGPAGDVLATDATLNGDPPQIPSGVRLAATASGRDTVTWQPQAGLRIALVVVPFPGGTVASGRSLRLVEERVAQTELITGVALVGGLSLIAVLAALGGRIWPERPSPNELA